MSTQFLSYILLNPKFVNLKVEMTGQISDSFMYENEEYNIAGITGGELFHPFDFGIETRAASTACWRGFQAFYTILNDKLVLHTLFINMKEKKKISDIEPKKGEGFFEYSFPEINIQLDFTGKILLARDFIDEMYVHMGFQRPMSYRKVIELHFEEGSIIKVNDLSRKMEEMRKQDPTKDAYPENPRESRDWIEKTFSLDYESDD